ncbi:hypothetical protein B5807_01601 [Epicoccum nigrum]|uniref:Uncharacterized protein n=1 Tax=Epicoccum nigrum TaxID=105696 RepID=A0A1Y2MCS5_EPING|nr:hypothetical protein B5807_01601 [Epicoccum nigrum]
MRLGTTLFMAFFGAGRPRRRERNFSCCYHSAQVLICDGCGAGCGTGYGGFNRGHEEFDQVCLTRHRNRQSSGENLLNYGDYREPVSMQPNDAECNSHEPPV